MALPILQALLLADHVYADQVSGKFVICGVFNTLYFTPRSEQIQGQVAARGTEAAGAAIAKLVHAGSPHAYLSLTEFEGAREFELRYVNLSQEEHEGSVLFSMKIRLTSPGPLETVQWATPLPPLPMSKEEEEGAYALELLCENEWLGSHKVLLKRNPNI